MFDDDKRGNTFRKFSIEGFRTVASFCRLKGWGGEQGPENCGLTIFSEGM